MITSESRAIHGLRVIACLTLIATGSTAFAGDPVWQGIYGNHRNTNYTPLRGPTTPVLKWVFEGNETFDISSRIDANPVVSSDGLLFVPTQNLGGIAAFNNDGDIVWFRRETRFNRLTADRQGGLYASNAGTVGARRFDRHGNVIQSGIPKGSQVNISPIDEAVFRASSMEKVIANDEDGALRWSIDVSKWSRGIAIDDDGTVYADLDHTLNSVNPLDGSINWTYDTSNGSNNTSAPVITDQGNILTVGSSTVSPMSILPNGELDWIASDLNFNLGRSYIMADPNGNSYFYLPETWLYAFDPDGNVLWSRDLNATFPPILTGDGQIIVALKMDAEGYGPLKSISALTGEDLWEFDMGYRRELEHVVPGADGLIYVTGRNWDGLDGLPFVFALVPEPSTSIGFIAVLMTIALCRVSTCRLRCG